MGLLTAILGGPEREEQAREAFLECYIREEKPFYDIYTRLLHCATVRDIRERDIRPAIKSQIAKTLKMLVLIYYT